MKNIYMVCVFSFLAHIPISAMITESYFQDEQQLTSQQLLASADNIVEAAILCSEFIKTRRFIGSGGLSMWSENEADQDIVKTLFDLTACIANQDSIFKNIGIKFQSIDSYQGNIIFKYSYNPKQGQALNLSVLDADFLSQSLQNNNFKNIVLSWANKWACLARYAEKTIIRLSQGTEGDDTASLFLLMTESLLQKCGLSWIENEDVQPDYDVSLRYRNKEGRIETLPALKEPFIVEMIISENKKQMVAERLQIPVLHSNY